MRRLRIPALLRSTAVALLACAALMANAAGQARSVGGVGTGPGALEQRMNSFLQAVNRRKADTVATLFPRTGDWTYLHTTYLERGRHVGVRRFRGGEALQAIRARGPLWEPFTIQYEGQPIGLFAHQVMLRGTAWRRVRGTRFVPPGAPASSGIFVEWRHEEGEWVVSAFGDESFKGRPLPAWCC